MDITSPLWYACYLLVLIGMSGYGFHRLTIVYLYLKHRNNKPQPKELFKELPLVTIQLPVFNEMHVVDRLLDSVAALDYPKDKMQIQIIDDSTDETTAICEAGAARLRAMGFDAEMIHRDDRTGYKAGALENATPFAKGEYLFILDADFVPNPDVLQNISVSITVEVGRTSMKIRDLLRLTQGSVVELDRIAGEPLDLLVNNTVVAQGEVVLVNDRYGIRLTRVVPASERMKNI